MVVSPVNKNAFFLHPKLYNFYLFPYLIALARISSVMQGSGERSEKRPSWLFSGHIEIASSLSAVDFLRETLSNYERCSHCLVY
jgi:hypothetical protein